MIKIMRNRDKSRHPGLFRQMFKLRAQEFYYRRRWDVRLIDGLEIDIFDELDPVYVLVVNPANEVLASLRLLPTTGPYMISDVFPDLMGDEPMIHDPLIWEGSRFCVDPKKSREMCAFGTRVVTKQLLLGAVEVAQKAGIEKIIAASDMTVTRILNNCGCQIERIGQPQIYGKVRTIAGFAHINATTIASLSDGLVVEEMVAA